MTYRELYAVIGSMHELSLDDEVCVVHDEHFPDPGDGYIPIEKVITICLGHEHTGPFLLSYE
jgi:hypothetical protein